MKITKSELRILIQETLREDRLFEGALDFAAKNALIVYINATDENTIRSKIKDLVVPSSIDQIKKKSKPVLKAENFKRTQWWFENLSKLIDKKMAIRFVELFFDDRDKLYDEIGSFINTHWDKLEKQYISTFSDDDIVKLLSEDMKSNYAVYERDVREDDDPYLIEYIKDLQNFSRPELEEELAGLLKRHVRFDKGDVAADILPLKGKSEVMSQIKQMKDDLEGEDTISLIIKGIYNFIG